MVIDLKSNSYYLTKIGHDIHRYGILYTSFLTGNQELDPNRAIVMNGTEVTPITDVHFKIIRLIKE